MPDQNWWCGQLREAHLPDTDASVILGLRTALRSALKDFQ